VWWQSVSGWSPAWLSRRGMERGRGEVEEGISLGSGEKKEAEGKLRAGRNRMTLEQSKVLYKLNFAH